ncbi:ribonuclease III [Desulfocurvus sp.]|jgi:ribonuclease-3|uniref:ribonuclease III n=1 Tax=Desulfocurvus sp. TaxID=2871698 RepID=UPI0025B85FD4|nr:ribonuclease III [Desulfocurvus sp.]MCK9238974.1 ribonuclease III [Desulfocurvus sp.]
MTQDLDTLQEVISHRFSQVKLLETALTHSSFANEHEEADRDNERLEFLGDAVLELGVSEMLYERNPEAPEGELTRMRARLVSEPALAALARELGLDGLLRLGRGEELQGGRTRDALLADAFEAVLGAVFLDGGFAAARGVVRGIYARRLPGPGETRRVKDAKSRLQELTQKDFRERPAYALLGGSGPDHAKVFEVELTLPDGTRLRATGPTVKKAEQDAAARALALLRGTGASPAGED